MVALRDGSESHSQSPVTGECHNNTNLYFYIQNLVDHVVRAPKDGEEWERVNKILNVEVQVSVIMAFTGHWALTSKSC
jgi:hypothetical protein